MEECQRTERRLIDFHEDKKEMCKVLVDGSQTYGYVQLLETGERVGDSCFVQL